MPISDDMVFRLPMAVPCRNVLLDPEGQAKKVLEEASEVLEAVRSHASDASDQRSRTHAIMEMCDVLTAISGLCVSMGVDEIEMLAGMVVVAANNMARGYVR